MDFGFGDDTEQLFFGIHNLIKNEWKPKQYTQEAYYTKDLYHFLRKKLREDRRIKKEGGENRCDIEINKAIGIELKKDLKGKSQVDRALGQIKRYKNNYRYVLIVLCGIGHTEFIDDLRHEIKEFIDEGDYISNNQNFIKIIDKTEDESNEELEEEEEGNEDEEEENDENDGEDIFGINKWQKKMGKQLSDAGFNI